MSESLEPLDPAISALLDSERAGPGMPAAAKDRLGALLAELPPPAIDTGATGEAADAVSNTAKSASEVASDTVSAVGHSTAKLVVVSSVTFAVGAGAGLGVHAALDDRELAKVAPPPPPVVAMAPAIDAAPPPSPPDAPVPVDASATKPASTRPRRPRPTKPPAETNDQLAIERSFLETARAALQRGDASRALQRLRAHNRRFPRGTLAEERDALWVQALVVAGEYDKAKVRASRFRHKYPTSLFREAVDHAIRQVP